MEIVNYRVLVLDAASNTFAAKIELDGTPFGVAVDPQGHAVYVTTPATGTLWVLDGRTATVVRKRRRRRLPVLERKHLHAEELALLHGIRLGVRDGARQFRLDLRGDALRCQSSRCARLEARGIRGARCQRVRASAVTLPAQRVR
jgi:hypothetical protein